MKTDTDNISTDKKTNFPKMSASQLFDLNNPENKKKQEWQSKQPERDSRCFDYALCTNGKQCKMVCASEKCGAKAVICGDKNCQCWKAHKGGNGSNKRICAWIDHEEITEVIEEVQKKRTCNSELIQEVNRKFDSLIDEISNQREKIINKLETLGLSDLEVKFLNSSYKHDFEKIDGKMIGEIVRKMNSCIVKEYLDMSVLEMLIIEQLNQIKATLNEQFKNLTNYISQIKIGQQNEIEKLQMMIDSKIVKTKEEENRLFCMFSKDRQPIKMRCIYRASQNEFKVSKFWDKCNGKGNTVTLIKTTAQRIIGGYTPIVWKRKEIKTSYGYRDNSGSSFLFSLTENAKFQLEKSSNIAVEQHMSKGPCFGSYDLWLSDKSNEKKDSYAYVGYNYTNPAFQKGYQNTFKRFTGSGESRFQTIEWEVHEVIYEPESQPQLQDSFSSTYRVQTRKRPTSNQTRRPDRKSISRIQRL